MLRMSTFEVGHLGKMLCFNQELPFKLLCKIFWTSAWAYKSNLGVEASYIRYSIEAEGSLLKRCRNTRWKAGSNCDKI